MAEHSTDLGHHNQFQDTNILGMKARYMEHIIREETEIELHPDNMNREEGFSLSKSLKLLLQTLEK
jgi:hypothetical protein